MRYLLDTNVVSDLVRNPQGRVMQRIREVGEARVCTIVTDNEREFARVDNLPCENWLREA